MYIYSYSHKIFLKFRCPLYAYGPEKRRWRRSGAEWRNETCARNRRSWRITSRKRHRSAEVWVCFQLEAARVNLKNWWKWKLILRGSRTERARVYCVWLTLKRQKWSSLVFSMPFFAAFFFNNNFLKYWRKKYGCLFEGFAGFLRMADREKAVCESLERRQADRSRML